MSPWAKWDADPAAAPRSKALLRRFLLVAVGLPEHIASFRAESGWDGELYVCADHRAPAAGVYGTYGLRNGQECAARIGETGGDAGVRWDCLHGVSCVWEGIGRVSGVRDCVWTSLDAFRCS